MAGPVIGEAIIVVGADGRPFKAYLEGQAPKETQQAGLGMSAILTKTLKRGAVIAGAAISTVLGASLVKGFQRLSAIDQARAKLEGLGHSAKVVETVMKNALASVKGTAFGLGDAASVAASTVAAGIKPGKQLERVLKLIADTATIAGTSMNDVGAIFNKVAAQGKVQGDELAQLTERGIPALAFLSKELGKSTTETFKMVSAGKVSFPIFARAMEKGLGGAAKSSGKTFSGALANVMAALGRLGAGVLQGVFSQMPALFASMIDKIDVLTPMAERLGKALGQGFSQALDVVRNLAGEFSRGEGAGGALRTVLEGLVDALKATYTAGTTVVGYFQDHTAQAKLLGVVMGTLLAITQAHAATLAVQGAGGLLAYLKNMRLVTFATKVWTAVQWALNLALNNNPIARVVTLISLLVGGIVFAWKNSETFRNVVLAVWGAIKKAVGAVVDWITNTAVPWLVDAWKSISDGASSLGRKIKEIWDAVVSALKAAANWVVRTFGPAFRTMAAIVEAAIKAAMIIVMALYTVVIKPYFTLVINLLKLLGSWFSWLYDKAVKPALQLAELLIKAWWATVKIIFNEVKKGLDILGQVFSWLYREKVKPAMDLAKAVVKATWEQGIRPAFDALKTAVGKVADAFGKAKDGIGKAWGKLEGLAKKPIKFVIQTVLNNGLIKAFNWLGSKVGGPKIDPIPLPFARGGVLPGYTPGRDVHRFWSPTGGRLDLSGGEAIMRPEFTRAMGGPAGIAKLNEIARRGGFKFDYASGGVFGQRARAYAGGGVIDWIKKQAASSFNWVSDKASATYKALTNPLDYLKSKLPRIDTSTALGSLGRAATMKLVEVASEKIKSLFKVFNRSYTRVGGYTGEGGGTAAALVAFGRWLQGQGYSVSEHPAFGGVSPVHVKGSKHYIGQAIDVNRGAGTSVLEQNYLRRIIGPAVAAGFRTIFMAPGHYNHAHISLARGGLWSPKVFDRGGVLPPGVSMVHNKTGRPEPLVPGDLAGGDTYIEVKLTMTDLEQLKTLDDFLRMLGRARVEKRRTARSGTVAT